MTTQILCGEALSVLRELPAESEDVCVTSPPYWRMRDYGHDKQLGMESTVEEFVMRLADIFDEVSRVLVPTGSAWVNLGDSYIVRSRGRTKTRHGSRYLTSHGREPSGDLKIGDLALMPARFAIEAQRRGWWVRQEVIWHKLNPSPDVTDDRPGRTHETIWLLTKRGPGGYYYNPDAVLTPLAPKTLTTTGTKRQDLGSDALDRVRSSGFSRRMPTRRHRVDDKGEPIGARAHSVWSVAVRSNRERVKHFAMQPDEIASRCILFGSPPGGRVLDPFAGAGTTGIIARRLGRHFTGIDLVADTVALANKRIAEDAPLLALDIVAPGA